MASSFLGRLRNTLWPKMGWRRYGTYLSKRVLRLSASPHAIAAGVASGAAVSMLPLVGLHFLLGFVLAYLVRGNMVAAAIGTVWGNPLTFPLFFALSYEVGHRLLGGGDVSLAESARFESTGEQLSQGLFAGGLDAIWPTFQTMFIGAIPIAVLVFALFYVLVRWLVIRFRTARQKRLALKRARRAESET
ncbi:membrane protein [Devosia pacifica]|uniref:Membrane protein n=1 Tax=Devosia pacifica TaxID=1335967 RepID=A0A918RYL0_9HYPH|nr:DUF2062 domain-containing protein [Devosia pacifica]GHA17402.1 membrane protein [Devosia pacifica]